MRILLSAIVAVCALNSGAASAQVSWEALEVQLRNAPGELFAPKPLLSILEKNLPNTSTNTRVLTEMAVQSNYPCVAVAGLTALQQNDRELAYRISLHKIWNSTNIASPVFVPFLEILANNLEPTAFRSAFQEVALSEPAA